MTGFDETVPPELDPDEDATSARDAKDNVVPPAGGPTPPSSMSSSTPNPADDPFPTEQEDADEGEPDVEPFAGDDDIAAGHPGEG